MQSYPYSWDSGTVVEAFTGSSERQSLGYWWLKNNIRYDSDAVYPIRMTVPHTADTLKLFWITKMNTDSTEQQSIGLDNMRITALSAERQFKDDEWAKLKKALVGNDAVAASQVVQPHQRALAGAVALGDLRERLAAPHLVVAVAMLAGDALALGHLGQ